MLMSEIAHMRKLYNDIIYFVQNHVKPVAPSNNFPIATPPMMGTQNYYNQVQAAQPFDYANGDSTMESEISTAGTKLFGVNLQSKKKRLHAEYCSSDFEISKSRLVLEKDDLGLNLMPPSPC